MSSRKLANLVGFQAVWFACVLFAAAGRPWLGVAVLAAVLALHFRLAPSGSRSREAKLLAGAAVLGLSGEWALHAAAVTGYPPQAWTGEPAPAWMVALWINFASTLHFSLEWLQGRFVFATMAGGVGWALVVLGRATSGGDHAESGTSHLDGRCRSAVGRRDADAGLAGRGNGMSFWAVLGLGWVAMAIAMALLWQVQRSYGKAGIVDILWAAGVGVLGVLFAFLATGGYPPRRLLIGLLAGGWSLRLTSYLLVRVLKLAEDGRYEAMKLKWGERTQSYLFAFFQVQAFWSVMFAAPMLVAAGNSTAPLGWLDAAGVAVFIAAVCGETIADRQLQAFRSAARNKGKVCRDGLWRYSRHPNYFFEWVHWWAYVLIGWQAPFGWATLFGPAIMLLFLFKVTGIPPTEENALRSRGDAYREYQRTTSVFFPLPPKVERTQPA